MVFALATGDTFVISELTETTTYFAEASLNGCISDREAVIATINSEPSVGTVSNTTSCNIGGITILDLDDQITGADSGSWSYLTGPTGETVEINADNTVDFNGKASGEYSFTYRTNTAIAPCVDQSVRLNIVVDTCDAPIDLEITKEVDKINAVEGEENCVYYNCN